MNLNKIKKDLTPEFKKNAKKSKFNALTNENDFLVKNLKKAGWFIKIKNILNNKFSKIPLQDKIIIFLND